MAPTIATKTLPSEAKLPVLGLGVFHSEPGAETYNAVLSALKLGCRHLDTAQYYENEADVGRARLGWNYNKAMKAAKDSNKKLGLGYIDLYLLHAPLAPEHREDAWRAVEDLHEQGILKDIGVSNFSEAHLEKLFKTARVKPCVNQVEQHPRLMRTSLVKYCQEHDIILQAYSPLARVTKMDDPELVAIAEEVSASPAQVLIAFSLANGFVTLPKSVHAERQLSNLEATNIKLTPEQVERLASPDSYIPTAPWDPIKQHVG